VIRLGAAGSLTTVLCDFLFYPLDCINVRTKILEKNIPMHQMALHILNREGPKGLYQGYHCCFYGNVIYGFSYFIIYKSLKNHLAQYFPGEQKFGMYVSASIMAEVVAQFMFYPFELAKIRILTKNHSYQYLSAADALRKIVQKDSFPGLYKGLSTFYANYVTYYTI